MIVTFSQALAQPLVKTVSRNDENGIFKVRIGIVETVITIIVSALGDGTFESSQDHAIKTDLLAGPYRTRCRPYKIPGEALDNALSTLCFYYRLAQRHGHEPKASWFIAL
jgi:hypothetical protein